MTPADVPLVQRLLVEQNERDGTSYGLPVLFDAQGRRLQRIPLALVAEDEHTHRVEQATVWEQTLEMTSYGTNPRATACTMREQGGFIHLLRERGYRDMHTFVPMERVEQIGGGLDRILKMKGTGLTHFYRMLDPEENERLRQWYEAQEIKR